jgi:hypothetical protein
MARSSSMIAPLTREIAYTSNLTPRSRSYLRSADDGSSEEPPLAGRDRGGRSGVWYPAHRAGAVGAPARLVSSGARVRLLVDAAEPLVRHVRVGLGRGQGNVPQQLLHGP